jgi:hypothetical protein
VIARVPVSAYGAFDVLDSGVVRLDPAGGGAGKDEDLDLCPPSAQGAVELVRIRLAGGLSQGLEFVFRAVASARDPVRSRTRSCSLTFHAACSPVASCQYLREG